MESYLFLLLVLACPLAMFFMMRGMGGSQGRTAEDTHSHEPDADTEPVPLDQLRRRRDELDREIERCEAGRPPVGSGWR